MELVNARFFYNLPKDALWSYPDKRFILEFEDGVVETDVRKSVFSAYCCALHRHYPEAPLLMCHHIQDEITTKHTSVRLMENSYNTILDTYGDKADTEKLWHLCYQTLNDIYNDFTTNLKPYVSTISALDFVDALANKEINSANTTVEPTQDSIDEAYSKISKALNSPENEDLHRNTIGRMAKSGLVSMGQIRQCVGPRGFTTDIDSNIFKDPILHSFAGGLKSLDASMKESRSASKANKFANENVSDTEYFSRELQLMSSTVARIHKGDCGTTKHILVTLSASDFERFLGKKYIDDLGHVKEIMKGDRKLIGQTLKIRSPIKCQHPDSYGVCSVCFGKLADSIPKNTNIGHVSATVMGEKVSQNVLSTKHLDMSSKVDEFVLEDFDAKFIRVVNEPSRYSNEEITVIKLAESMEKRRVKLTLSSKQARNLTDLDYHDLDNISAPTIGKLKEIMLTVVHEENFEETVTLPVSMGSRLSWLTMDVLEYIKQNGYFLDDRGDYVVDLSSWDINKPMFQLPLKHTDMVQYMRQVKTFIMNTNRSKSKHGTPDDFLMNFYNLVNSKLSINFAHLEIIVLSSMVKDFQGRDHRLPVPASEGELSPYRDNMKFRSLGPSMAYEGQGKEIMGVRSFINDDRPDSIYDNLLCPYPEINPRD